MLGGHHDQGVGFGRRDGVAHAPIASVEGLSQLRVGHARAAGDPRGVAGNAGENQTHTPATFSSWVVVMA